MKLAIIANPWAGRGRSRAFIDRFHEEVGALDLEVVVDYTRGPRDGIRLARTRAPEVDVIGILGGDGTVHEVVNGIMPNPPPIVIVPSGSGNDFASLVDCPTTPHELADILAAGRGALVDVLDFGDRYCVNSAGLGFEGLVNRYSHSITRLKGSFLYLAAVFKALSKLEVPTFRIRTGDGQEIDGQKLMVSIGNGNRTGGAFYLLPDALPDDGLIDLCVVDAMGPGRVITLLPRAIRGTHTSRAQVEMFRTESIRIDVDGQHPMHVDGELVDPMPNRLDVRVMHRVLPVLCRPAETNRLQHPLQQIL